MKNLKKVFAVFLCVVFLTGCSEPGRQNDAGDCEKLAFFTEHNKSSTLPESDYFFDHRWIPTGVTEPSNYENTYFVDTLSGFTGRLCSAPGCNHSDDTCTAFSTSKTMLSAHNDRYLVTVNISYPDGEWTIQMQELNGANKRVLYSFLAGEQPPIGIVLGEKNLYFSSQYFSDNKSRTYVKKISLETGKGEEIFTLSENEEIIGARDNIIYINRWPRFDLGFITSGFTSDNLIYSIDTKGNIVNKKLFQFNMSESSVITRGHTIACINSKERAATILNGLTGDIKDYSFEGLNDMDSFTPLFLDEKRLIFSCYSSENEATYGSVFSLRLENKEISPVPFYMPNHTGKYGAKARVTVTGQTGDSYIVIYDYKTVKFSGENLRPGFAGYSGPWDYELNLPVYATILKDDFLNGIPNFRVLGEI